ncbi:MAG: hypothetical protein ACP5VF_13680, partial [Acidobacteriota bacterium]
MLELRRPRARPSLAIFAFVLFIYFILLNHATSSGPDGLNMALQYSLLVRHTWGLGNPSLIQPVTDQVEVVSPTGSQWYGTQSYGLAIIALPFAALGQAMQGHAFSNLGPLSYADRLFVAMISAAFVAALYEELRSLGWDPRASAFTSLALAFTTTLWPESEVFMYMPLSAAALTLFIAETYRALTGRGAWKRAWLAAALLGVAAWADYSIIAAMLALSALLALVAALTAVRDRAAILATALIPLDVAAGLQMATSYAAFGDPLFVPGLAVGRTFVPALAPLHAFYYVFSPYRGIIFYDPIAALALAYAVARRRRRPLLSLMVLVAFVAQLAEVSSWYYWDGGLSYGPRLLLPALAPAMLFLPYAYEDAARSLPRRDLLMAAAALGLAINA